MSEQPVCTSNNVERLAKGLFFSKLGEGSGIAEQFKDEVWDDRPDASRFWEHDDVPYSERGRDYYRELAHIALSLLVPPSGWRADREEVEALIKSAMELRAFLGGEADFEGVGFGEVPPGIDPLKRFWWRRHLDRFDRLAEALAASLPLSGGLGGLGSGSEET